MADTPASVTREPDTTPRGIASKWLGEIEAAGKFKIAEWHKRGDLIIRRYKDERDESQYTGATKRRMNILWSNVQTIEPACYSLTPKPNVQRRNKDKDPVGRWAAIVLERCLAYVLSAQDFDYTMRLAVSDYLLPGRGTIWEVYEPQIAVVDGEERVEWETTRTKYIHWKDFLTNPARTWGEVTWCAHRAYLSRDELRALLRQIGSDPEIATKVTLDHTVEGTPRGETADDTNRKATVWCLWSKPDRKTFYIAKGYQDGPLGVTAPPLKLDSFFPCPRPLTATTASDSTIPVPDYCQYQDQAEEIDELTQRIYLLSRAIVVRGVYDSASPVIGNILNDSLQSDMIPCDTWAMFAEKGGFKGAVDFFPIDAVVAALKECIVAREAAKQALYEITGISDILRGASDPGETLGAQQIKTQWGGLRVRDRQKEVQRFARDIIRIKAEVIAETFSPETLKTMSGVKLLSAAEKQQGQALLQRAQAGDPKAQQMVQSVPPDTAELMQEPTWDEVIALLRSDKLRGFSIDIETDSTVQPDETAERQSAVEFGTMIGSFLQQAGPIAQDPKAAPLLPMLGDMLTFMVRRFKAGETMETQIEHAMEQLGKQQAQPQPNPEQAKAEAQAKLDEKKHNDTMQQQAQQHQDSMTLEREKLAANTQLERERMATDAALTQQKQDADAANKRASLDAQQATQAEVRGLRADNAVEKDTVTGKTQEIVTGAMSQMSDTLAAAIGQLAEGMKAMAQAQAQQGTDIKAGMSQLAQATMAEQELVRDQAGRAIGARRKMAPPTQVN